MNNASGSTLQDTTEPESESTDNFPTYTAGEAFVQGLAGLVNQSDVETMIRAQKQMLQRFEKTNEMLLNCNALSQSRLKGANEDFKRHVKLLNEMKKDLDYTFRKIRIIKQKLSQNYPAPFSEAQAQRSSLAEEAEDDLEKEARIKIQLEETTASAINNTTQDQRSIMESVSSTLAQEGKNTEGKFIKKEHKSENKISTTVEYVQMEETIDNGKPIENELIKRVCSIETTNPNDSSDCTSEDTG